MQQLMPATPVVMSITSLDPCGGAGISADIETLASLGCHCTPIITRLCVNDTREFKDSHIIDSNLLIEQVRAVLEDISINLFKVGDIASVGNAEAIHTILNDYPHIPVIIDPEMETADLQQAVGNLLIPHAELTVLDQQQVHAMAASADNLAASVQEILELGCDYLLVTDVDDTSGNSSNRLFSDKGQILASSTQVSGQECLGAGCTLSAATSAYRAHQINLLESVKQAQQFTCQALSKARRIGMGLPLPDRMHWCKK